MYPRIRLYTSLYGKKRPFPAKLSRQIMYVICFKDRKKRKGKGKGKRKKKKRRKRKKEKKKRKRKKGGKEKSG